MEAGAVAIPLPPNRGVDIFGNLWYNHFAQNNADISLYFVHFGNLHKSTNPVTLLKMKVAQIMKHFLAFLSTVLLVAIVFAMPVSAVVHTCEISFDFTDYFIEDVQTDGNGTVLFWFIRGPFDSATVNMYMREGCTIGRTFVQIFCNGGEIRSASSHDIVDNVISCAAGLTDRVYTTKTNFYATREYNGVATAWDYSLVAPTHDINSLLDTTPSTDVN